MEKEPQIIEKPEIIKQEALQDEAQKPVLVSEVLPDKLSVMPITPRPVFPHIMLPLTFTGERSIETIKDAVEKQKNILFVKNDLAILLLQNLMKIFRELYNRLQY